MKLKLLFTTLFAIVLTLCSSAQIFENGGRYVHAGLGLGSGYTYSGSRIVIPPMHVSYEQGITDRIGIGGLVGFASSRFEGVFFNNDTYSWRSRYFVVGARGAYHFTEIEEADIYVAGMLGFNFASSKFKSSNASLEKQVTEPAIGGLVYGACIGARYQLNDQMILFGELGYSIAYLNLGICFKL